MRYDRTTFSTDWLNRTLRGCGIVVGLGLALIAGCDSGPKVYQVRGKVTYKGGTAPKAGVRLVRFEPVDTTSAQIRKGASGAIADDGSFELFTRKPGDGVHRGEYAVVFTVCKGPMDTKPLIVEKYADPNSSPYKVTVDRNLDDLEFEIEPLPPGA